MRTYYVYIMTNQTRTRYTGVTNSLERCVVEHKRKLLPGFTRQYNINRLVHYETFGDIRAAIQREKQIKGWLRAKKVALIVTANPAWKELSGGKDKCWHPWPTKRAQGDIRAPQPAPPLLPSGGDAGDAALPTGLTSTKGSGSLWKTR